MSSVRSRTRAHTGRYLLLGLAAWLFLGLVLDHFGHNQIVRGTWVVLGAGLVPAALVYAMSHRLRSTDTIASTTLLKAFVLGGFFSFLIGATFDTLVGIIAPGANGSPSLVSYALSGVVEEAAKATLVVVIGWKVAKTMRNGLFLGGAVGAGFALFETIGYIDFAPTMLGGSQAAPDGEIFQAITAIERGLTMPFGHPLWAALLGAAIFAAAKNDRFRLAPSVLLAYLGVAVMHGLWDSGRIVLADLVPNPYVAAFAGIPVEIIVAVVGVIVWRRVAREANKRDAQRIDADGAGSSRIEEAPVTTAS